MTKQCGSYLNHPLDFPYNFPYTQPIFQKITIYWDNCCNPHFSFWLPLADKIFKFMQIPT